MGLSSLRVDSIVYVTYRVFFIFFFWGLCEQLYCQVAGVMNKYAKTVIPDRINHVDVK